MTDFANEEWRAVPGFEGLYSVSSIGRVRSEKRIIKERRPNPLWKDKFYEIEGRMLKPALDNCGGGYYRVNLSKNSVVKQAHVHRLVAWAFIGPQGKGIEARHINGNSRDNSLENIAYGTKSDNMQDSIRHGTFPVGERRPGARITRYLAIEIANAGKIGMKINDVVKKFCVSKQIVGQIWRGETWVKFTGVLAPIRFGRKYHLVGEKELKILADHSISVIEKDGTRAENIADSIVHGTFSEGERRPCCALSTNDVLFIINSDLGYKKVAEMFNIHPFTVHKIRRGDVRSRETEAARSAKGKREGCFKFLALSCDDDAILRDFSIPQRKAADILKVPQRTIWRWRKKLVAQQ